VYNEAESLPLQVETLHTALDPLVISWEMVFVADGSHDNSMEVLENLAEGNADRMRVVMLRRNFGQTAAIAAGIDHEHGDVIDL